MVSFIHIIRTGIHKTKSKEWKYLGAVLVTFDCQKYEYEVSVRRFLKELRTTFLKELENKLWVGSHCIQAQLVGFLSILLFQSMTEGEYIKSLITNLGNSNKSKACILTIRKYSALWNKLSKVAMF